MTNPPTVAEARDRLGEAIDNLFVAGTDATSDHLHAPDEALAVFEDAVRREARAKLSVVGFVPVDDSGQPWLLHANYSKEAVLTDEFAMAHCKERNVVPLYRHADDA